MTKAALAVELDRVRFTWGRGQFELDIPAFEVRGGETVLLLGDSGSGKSTLLSLICGTLQADEGRLQVLGQSLKDLRGPARDRFRGENIGVIFQVFNLLPYASGLDNILLPLGFAPARRARTGDARAEALELTRALGLEDHLVTGPPAARLSVGQQQRVAVARALIGQPALIVADEPTSALDATAQADFLDRMFAQVRHAGSTLLMVSHDVRIGARFDRVVNLRDLVQTRRGAA